MFSKKEKGKILRDGGGVQMSYLMCCRGQNDGDFFYLPLSRNSKQVSGDEV